MAAPQNTNHVPYLINKNLGQPMGDYAHELPQKNADGLPIIEPTAAEKYKFDKDGWILYPAVLSGDELAEMHDFCLRLHFEPESLPEHSRTPLAGPTQRLFDHPIVAGLLNEFMANPSLSSQECYGFSLGGCGLWYRTAPSRRNEGRTEDRGFGPHNGNGLYRLPGDVHYYQAFPGKGHSPHTRIVWELNPVKYRQGGTLLVTGSHKAVYTAPDDIQDMDSDVWSTYECPAGSLLIFAEAVTHSAHPWTNAANDRMAVHGLYNPVDSGFARPLMPPPEVLEQMPPMRRTLFRDRYVAGNVVGADFRRLY
jgi:hypothetical protein